MIDAPGQVFSLLRSLNLGVKVRRGASPAGARYGEVALNIVAAYDETEWDMIRELSEVAPTVIVATSPNDDDAYRAFAAGALGYLGTHLPPEALRRAILGALRGEHAFSRRVLSTVIGTLRSLRTANVPPLTPRQREVVIRRWRGESYETIASVLGISVSTVSVHMTRALEHLRSSLSGLMS